MKLKSAVCIITGAGTEAAPHAINWQQGCRVVNDSRSEKERAKP